MHKLIKNIDVVVNWASKKIKWMPDSQQRLGKGKNNRIDFYFLKLKNRFYWKTNIRKEGIVFYLNFLVPYLHDT